MKYFKLILICAFLVMSNSYAQTKIMTFNIQYLKPNNLILLGHIPKNEIIRIL